MRGISPCLLSICSCDSHPGKLCFPLWASPLHLHGRDKALENRFLKELLKQVSVETDPFASLIPTRSVALSSQLQHGHHYYLEFLRFLSTPIVLPDKLYIVPFLSILHLGQCFSHSQESLISDTL